MRVLSLCDGLSCGLLAFKELGIDVEYYAVELDKYARALADSNLPGIIRPCHDVYDLTKELLDSIGVVDWVIFGFPCQKFSVAGTQGGLQSDPLLLQCMKILNYCKEKNPNLKFLIENVKMKKSLLDEVDAVIQSPFRTLINSALVSAQSRERWYWTNFTVGQPEDRGLVIADILEEDSGETVEKGNPTSGVVVQVNPDKSCGGKQPKMQDRIYHPMGKSVAMTSFAGRTNVGENELYYRKLTVRECARLQTIPEWYDFSAVSKTQAYKAIGNGMTVSVIAHIISQEEWL